jgi:hypothetical protein
MACPLLVRFCLQSRKYADDDQGLELTEEDMQVQLSRRRPGQSDITTAVRLYHYLAGEC